MTHASLLDVRRSVVVAIDLQGKLLEMVHRSRLVVRATCRLLQLADLFGVPVVLTEQYPSGLGPTHPDVRAAFDALRVPTRSVVKTSFGGFGDQGFRRALAELRPGLEPAARQVVVAGIEAHVCVMQTALELLREGGEVHLCWECISSRGEEYRRHALDRLQQAGAALTNHESAAFEWARGSEHEAFRAMNRILREGQLAD